MSPKARNAQALRAYDVVELSGGDSATKDTINAVDGQDGGSVGLVWRVAGETDSEYDSDEDAYSEFSEGPPGKLAENQAEVAWLGGGGPTGETSKVRYAEEDMERLRVVDRGMMVGDVVAATAAPLGQTGEVVEVVRELDVRLSTGEVRRGVPSAAMRPVLRFQPDQHVLHASGYLGRIEEVDLMVTVAFESGTVVTVSDMRKSDDPLLEPLAMSDTIPRPATGGEFFFYPGQAVSASAGLRHSPCARLVKGSMRALDPRHSRCEGVVLQVSVDWLLVTWLSNIAGTGEGGGSPPKEMLRPQACTPIDHLYFAPSYWHLATIGLWAPDGGPDAPAQKEPAGSGHLQAKAEAKGGRRGRRRRSVEERRSLPQGSGSAAEGTPAQAEPEAPPGNPSDPGKPEGAARQALPGTSGTAHLDSASGSMGMPAASADASEQGVPAAPQTGPPAEECTAPPPSSATPAAQSLAAGVVGADGLLGGSSSSLVPESPPTAVGAATASSGLDTAQAEGADAASCAAAAGDVVAAIRAATSALQDGAEAAAAANAAAPDSGWSYARRGWDAAAAVLSAATGGLRRAAPAAEPPHSTSARRGRQGAGKRRGRQRRSGSQPAGPSLRDLPVTAQVLRTRTRCTVHWQDGTEEAGVAAAQLLPVLHVDDHDFWPGDFVVEKVDMDEDDHARLPARRRNGYIKRVDHAQRTATVAWQAQDAGGHLAAGEPPEEAAQEPQDDAQGAPEAAGQAERELQSGAPAGETPDSMETAAATAPQPEHPARKTSAADHAADMGWDPEDDAGGPAAHANYAADVGWDPEDGAGGPAAHGAEGEEDEGEEEEEGAPERVARLEGDAEFQRLARQAELARLERAQRGPRPSEEEATVSVYSLQAHYDHTFSVGDVVLNLGRTLGPPGEGGNAAVPLHSVVGEVMRTAGGEVRVHWVDGTESSLPPDQLYTIGNEDDFDGSEPGEGEEDEQAPPAEYTQGQAFSAIWDAHNPRAQPGGGDADDGWQTASDEDAQGDDDNNDDDADLTALGLVRVASGEARDAGELPERAPGEDGPRIDASQEASTAHAPAATPAAQPDAGAPAAVGIPAEDTGEAAAEAAPSAGDAGAAAASDHGFARFEVLDEEPSSHHFYGEVHASPPAERRAFQRGVLKEWDMLRAGLPPGIWVCAYESRMDLLRAGVLGPEGTPYHDQLFVFDVQLAPGHPAVPPRVHYHSWGLRVNPNLYEDGKVCLSLLNTWAGRGSENWDPKSSSVLQVLVSIQGLVLVPQPYFNEAGFEKQVGSLEGNRNAGSYSENVFLLVCRSSMQLLRRPPPPFEPLIKAVYRERRDAILAACKAYLEGTVAVGGKLPSANAGAGENSSSEEPGRPDLAAASPSPPQAAAGVTTQGFQLVLKGLLPRLEAALNAL